MKKNILVMCPLPRDRRELALLQSDYNFVFHPFDSMAIKRILLEHSARLKETFEPAACPLCQKDIPLVKPGS